MEISRLIKAFCRDVDCCYRWALMVEGSTLRIVDFAVTNQHIAQLRCNSKRFIFQKPFNLKKMFTAHISKEFLEKELNCKFDTLSVSPGSNVGDNFMGSIYAIDIKLQTESVNGNLNEHLYLVAKCYPEHIGQHEYLNRCSVFLKEMSVYNTLVNDITEHLRIKGVDLKLPFAKYFSGAAIDFSKQSGIPRPNIVHSNNGANNSSTDFGTDKEFFYNPLDNFLLLEDARRTRGFRMRSHRLSLDWDHCSVVVDELAKIHAIGWSYQQQLGSTRTLDKYPYLKPNPSPIERRQLFMNYQFEPVLKILKEWYGTDSPIVERVEGFRKRSAEIMCWFDFNRIERSDVREQDLDEKYMRVPGAKEADDYVPWRVLCHYDCWTTNMLFRYDSNTASESEVPIPEEVILIDLQRFTEACPTMDLAYLIYTSTGREFRQKYLEQVLQKYHDRFVHYCKQLNVPLLPGFSPESIKRRFNRAKLFMYNMGIITIQLTLKDHQDGQGINSVEIQEGISHLGLFKVILNSSANSLMKQRIIELTQDMYDDGII